MLGYYRLLAATGVLIAHGSGGTDAMSRAMVSAFFIASGFLMALTLRRNYRINPLPFYWNRFLRLYPMHALVAVSVLVLAPSFARERFGDLPPVEFLLAFAHSLTLTFGSNPALVAPAWTLPYEILFYLFAPLVVGIRWRGVPFGILMLAAAAGGALAERGTLGVLLAPFAIGYGGVDAVYASMMMFAFGAALHEAGNFLWSGRGSHTFEVLGILLLAALIVFGSRYNAPDGAAFDARHRTVFALGTYVSSALILLGWTRSESQIGKLAGDLTYPVYLVHWPLLHAGLFEQPFMRAITDWFGHHVWLGQYFSAIVITLALSLLAAYVLLRVDGRFVRVFRASASREPQPRTAMYRVLPPRS